MTSKVWTMAGLLVAASAMAQVPSSAPAGATGICRDGSYSTAAAKSGACRGHRGVQTWYGASVAAMPAPTAEAKAAPALGPPTPAGAPVASAPAPRKPGPAAAAGAKTAAPGGGPGLVWVNASSKVYHCQGDPYYGKTKAGQYMTEDAAKASGAHGAHGIGCPAK